MMIWRNLDPSKIADVLAWLSRRRGASAADSRKAAAEHLSGRSQTASVSESANAKDEERDV